MRSFLISLLVLYAGFTAYVFTNREVAKRLNLDGLGDVSVSLGIASIAAAFLLYGGGGVAKRFVPEYIRNRDYAGARGLVLFFIAVCLTLALGAGALALSGAFTLQFFFDGPVIDRIYREVLFAMALAPLLAMHHLLSATHQACDRPVIALLPYEVIRPLVVLGGIFLAAMLITQIHDYHIIGVYIIGSLILIAFQLLWLVPTQPQILKKPNDYGARKEWLAIGKSLFFSGCVMAIIRRVDLLAIEIFHPDEAAVGAFVMLILCAEIVWLNVDAVSNVMSHKIAGLRNDRNGLEALIFRSIRTVFVMGILASIVLITFSRELVTFLHPSLEKYAPWLVFLAAGAVVNSCLEVFVYVVRYGGLHEEAARWSRVVLVANIVLTSGAVIVGGLEGALMSVVFIGFARGMLYVWLVVRKLGLRPSHMFLGRMDTSPVQPERAAE